MIGILILIWIDGTEREIFRWNRTLGQNIEECRFADIRDTYNSPQNGFKCKENNSLQTKAGQLDSFLPTIPILRLVVASRPIRGFFSGASTFFGGISIPKIDIHF